MRVAQEGSRRGFGGGGGLVFLFFFLGILGVSRDLDSTFPSVKQD